jgi:hypothetical protein
MEMQQSGRKMVRTHTNTNEKGEKGDEVGAVEIDVRYTQKLASRIYSRVIERHNAVQCCKPNPMQ